MPTNPVVLEGLRAPYDERKKEAESRPPVDTAIERAHDPQRGTKYISKHRRYRISVVPPQRKEVVPGVYEDTKGVSAVFEDHVYINDGGGNAEKRELYDKLLQRNPWYGMGRDFWLASEAVKVSTQQKIEGAVQAIRKNPEAVKALLEQLKSEGALDWALPPNVPEEKIKKSERVTKLE